MNLLHGIGLTVLLSAFFFWLEGKIGRQAHKTYKGEPTKKS